TRFLLVVLFVLLGTLLTISFTPFAVSNGLRLWVWWQARQERPIVQIDRIDAPFLRPVVLRGLHVTSASEHAFPIDLTATQARLDLSFPRILLRNRGHTLRH